WRPGRRWREVPAGRGGGGEGFDPRLDPDQVHGRESGDGTKLEGDGVEQPVEFSAAGLNERAGFATLFAPVHGALDGVGECVVWERFREVMEGLVLHALESALEPGASCHQHERCLELELTGLAEELEAAGPGELNVAEDH